MYQSASFKSWRTSVSASAARSYAREAAWLFGEVDALFKSAQGRGSGLDGYLREQVAQAEDVASEARALACTAWTRTYALSQANPDSDELRSEVGRHYTLAQEAAQRARVALRGATQVAEEVARAVLQELGDRSRLTDDSQAVRRRAMRLADRKPSREPGDMLQTARRRSLPGAAG